MKMKGNTENSYYWKDLNSLSVLSKSIRNSFTVNELAILTSANQSHAQYNSTLGKHFKMQSGKKRVYFTIQTL